MVFQKSKTISESEINKKIKKIKTISIILVLLLVSFIEHSELKKKYLEQSVEVTYKAFSIKSKYWGIQYFSEFNWFFTKTNQQKYQSLDLDSLEFQEYLNTQHAMFRLIKSSIFNKVTDICKNILNYQLKEKQYLEQACKHAAMVVITTLNDNIITDNKIDAKETEKDFLEKYGINENLPMNIFEILVEQEVLIKKNSVYSYKNQGVFNYFYNFSCDLMPLFKTSVNEQIRYITNFDLNLLLDVLEEQYIEFESEIQVYEKHKEFFKLKELILDWSNPEQYYEFEDKKLQAVYLDLNKHKNIINDKMFHSLLINSTGLGYYWYSKENLLDNYYYFMEK